MSLSILGQLYMSNNRCNNLKPLLNDPRGLQIYAAVQQQYTYRQPPQW
jgi:hypothetical protein